MKLHKLHETIETDLLNNSGIKSMLKPVSKQYYLKDGGKTDTKPPKPQSGPYQGGHFDALIEGNPRLKKYFGGSFLRAI
jgi:hypothetical protein